MSPFGFTPDNNDEENQKPNDFEAMMRQMQEQIQRQFQELGINPAGFINPFANFAPGAKGQQDPGKQQHNHKDPPNALPIIVIHKHDGLLWPVASRCLA